LVWFDGVRRRPTVRRAWGRARAGRVGGAAWACGSGGRWLALGRSDATARCGALPTTRRTATLGCCVGLALCCLGQSAQSRVAV